MPLEQSLTRLLARPLVVDGLRIFTYKKGMSRYKITCLDCNSSRVVGIIKSEGRSLIDWLDNNPDPQKVKIVSGRKRLDNEWGWQCVCGNDDILTKQEQNYITNKQSPDPFEISRLAKDLLPETPRFRMEEG